MAIELEKIAALLETAYDEISRLEEQNAQLQEENQSLQNLKKEAAGDVFDHNDDDIFSMGAVAEINSAGNTSADAKLDEFLMS